MLVVRHTPVGALGQLAVSAGQARGAQIRADQDIQFTSMALAAQDRLTQMGMAARDRDADRAFRFQQAASAQVAKRQATSPDTRNLQLQLQRTVKEAQSSGIYTPVQLKRMQIQANMGDERGLQSSIGREPKAPRAPARTARRQELDEQLEVYKGIREKKVAPLRKQVEFLEGLFGRRLGPDALDQLRRDPQFLRTIPEDLQTGFDAYTQIRQQIADLESETDTVSDRIRSGFSLPQQETAERRQATGIQRQETAAEKQKRTDAYRKLKALAAKHKLEIARVTRVESSKQRHLEKLMAAERINMRLDKDRDPDPQQPRIRKARAKLVELEAEFQASLKRMKEVTGITVGSPQTPGEEAALIDSLLEETGGDIEAAKRLLEERSSQ